MCKSSMAISLVYLVAAILPLPWMLIQVHVHALQTVYISLQIPDTKNSLEFKLQDKNHCL